MNKSNHEHTKSFPQPQKTTKNKDDSSTVDNFVLEGPRRSCSFKGNRKLWQAFVSYSKANYGSVCHILEPVILAILQAKVVQSRILKDEWKPIVIESLHIQRVVQRHRRVKHEYEPEPNFYNVW